jgi:hypothetical protein
MSEYLFPGSSILTNSARLYQCLHDFLMWLQFNLLLVLPADRADSLVDTTDHCEFVKLLIYLQVVMLWRLEPVRALVR